MRVRIWAAASAVGLAVLVARGAAHAQEVSLGGDGGEGVVPRASVPAPAPARPWVFLEDPTTPAPWHVVMTSRATYAAGASATRPFAANAARPGAMAEVGGELGVLPALSIQASGVGAGGGDERAGTGATAGVRLAPLAESGSPLKLSLAAGYVREVGGAGGTWARLDAAFEAGRLRLGTNVHAEHVFHPGRDAVDVLVATGATVRVAGPLRAGVEYVAQDLEGYFDDEEAEGGVRHFVGPTLALDRIADRLTIAASPGIGLSYTTPSLVGRLALAYAF